MDGNKFNSERPLLLRRPLAVANCVGDHFDTGSTSLSRGSDIVHPLKQHLQDINERDTMPALAGYARFDPTMAELRALPPSSPENDYQWWLINASRFAQSKGYQAGWWDGEMNGEHRGIICLGVDCVDLFTYSYPSSSRGPDVPAEARSRGHSFGGFWNGERTDDGVTINMNIAALKSAGPFTLEWPTAAALVMCIAPATSYNGQWAEFNHSQIVYKPDTFRAATRWARLPAVPGGPPRYNGGLPLQDPPQTSVSGIGYPVLCLR